MSESLYNNKRLKYVDTGYHAIVAYCECDGMDSAEMCVSHSKVSWHPPRASLCQKQV